MKCKIVQSVLFHGKHLQQGMVYDFESEHARELTEKGFVIPVKQLIKDLEATLEDETIQKVKAPVLAHDKHPAEKADQEAVVKRSAALKAKEASTKIITDIAEDEDDEVIDAMIDEEIPVKKPARKKKSSKKKG